MEFCCKRYFFYSFKLIASPDQIAMMIPPGESDLKSQKPERKREKVEYGEEYKTLEIEHEPEDSREGIKGEIEIRGVKKV